MYLDVVGHCIACPRCAVVHSSGRLNCPLLHPIRVQHVFQIVQVDIMDLPRTEAGNKHVVVFQHFHSKRPFVFPIPDHKSIRLGLSSGGRGGAYVQSSRVSAIGQGHQSAVPYNGGCVQAAGYSQAEHNCLPSSV